MCEKKKKSRESPLCSLLVASFLYVVLHDGTVRREFLPFLLFSLLRYFELLESEKDSCKKHERKEKNAIAEEVYPLLFIRKLRAHFRKWG
jgi:hypothetical protein